MPKKSDKVVMKNNYHLLFILVSLMSFESFASCAKFETTLESAMAKVAANGEKRALKQAWGSPEAQEFKKLYGEYKHPDSNNRGFITTMEADHAAKNGDVIYFNAQNSVQKKLNDEIIKDKDMVDAINNSFFSKLNKNLNDFPELKAKLSGKYVGFKDNDLRLVLKPGERASIEKQLAALYQKTNKEFVEEFEKLGLTKLISPRTDEVVDVSSWFLSGTGKTALEANMASRSARTAGFNMGSARTLNFSERMDLIHSDIMAIEQLRISLAGSQKLIKNGIMEKLPGGEVIPSEKMIEILRQTKLSECADMAEYVAKVKAKVKNQFNSDIDAKHVEDLNSYFQRSDSLSPPIYERERVIINLSEADHGLVSVDFTSVGVDNAYEQMRGLAAVNYGQKDKAKLIDDAFTKVQDHVDNVTQEMNEAKRFFTVASKKPNEATIPKFSGDDGMVMPKADWSYTEKIELIEKLSRFKNPSKFRVTFARSKFANGKKIPAEERSIRIVRAEKIEKEIRAEVIGALKIPRERAKKMIFAIDVEPNAVGGRYNLLVGGERTTPEENKMILDAFTKALKSKDGETLGNIIEAY